MKLHLPHTARVKHLSLLLLVALAGCSASEDVRPSTTGMGQGGADTSSSGATGTTDTTGTNTDSATGAGGTFGDTTGAGGTAGTSGEGGSGGTAPGDGGPGSDASTPSGDFAVFTNRYDNFRSAANTRETVLNTSNVKTSTFGLKFSRLIDGNPYAQPLYMPGLIINGAKHNVVFVATSTNHVYAFDADDPAAMTPFWSKQLAIPGDVRVGGSNPNTVAGQTWCKDMFPFVGITGTPVIDPATKRMYLITKEGKFGDAASYKNKLHSLDILTGAEAPGSPVLITASAGGQQMDGWKNMSRVGLLIHNGTLYLGFGSHCDDRPYQGWVLAYDPATLMQKSAFNTAPSGSMAAIWQSGIGLAANANGIFFSVGNGTSKPDGTALGLSVVRLTADNKLGDWFTPSNVDALNSTDQDLLSVLLTPNANTVFAGGKEGIIYVIDQMNMTHFNAGGDKITQRVNAGSAAHLHSMAFWNNRLYVWPEGLGMSAYSYANGKLTATPVATFDGSTPVHPGGVFSISANGTMAGTGVIWANVVASGDAWHSIAVGTLIALDAMTGTKLWDSNQDAADKLGNFAKYSVPTVANGKVYVTTFANVNATSPSYLRVYGLK